MPGGCTRDGCGSRDAGVIGHKGGCCAVSRGGSASLSFDDRTAPSTLRGAAELVALDGGWFRMGSADLYAYEDDGEGPVREVRVDPFRLAAHCVSSRQFAEFVEATGHVTSAERFGTSFVFEGLLPPDF